MSEGLVKKKKIRGGHRSSATRTISTIYETIESTVDRETVMTMLLQCKLTLKEKLETIKRYDDEILELVGDEEVENEIEQADIFKERVHRAIIDVTSAIETSRPTHDSTLHTVEPHVAAATSPVVTSPPPEASGPPVTTVSVSVPSTEASDIPVTSTTVSSTPVTLLTSSSLTSTTLTSAPPSISASPMVGLPVTLPVFSTPLLLSSGARTASTSSSSIPPGVT